MGILQKVFGRRRSLAAGVAEVRRPGVVEVEGNGLAHAGLDRAPTPRSRQELIEELQRNYTEVLGLVRKVDNHLDEQRDRGERLLAITRAVPDALDAVPALRTQADAIGRTVERLVEVARASDEHAVAAVNELIALGERLRSIDARGEALTGAVGEFRGSVQAMARSGERLNENLTGLQRDAALREDRLMSCLERQQRWLILALSLCGVGVALAMVVTIVALAA